MPRPGLPEPVTFAPRGYGVIGSMRRFCPERAWDIIVPVVILALLWLPLGCARHAVKNVAGQPLPRTGDEIMVAGTLFHTGAPVVLWTDPGGYDAYRVERRFAPPDKASWEETLKQGGGPATPNRYGERRAGLSAAQLSRIRENGWDLATLQEVVDQVVVHYDVAGTSRSCFRILHDVRGLSVHFMIDLDGTIYQTLDLKERAWHATTSNDRSVGIEIANIGAYADNEKAPFDRWYGKDASGRTIIHVPGDAGGPAALRTPGFVGRPSRPDPVRASIQGRELSMYDFTPEQYASLTMLTATLCRVFPKIRCDYPRDSAGNLITRKLPDDQLASYAGLLGHYHIQENKADPGPAMQWERVVDGARKMIGDKTPPAGPGRPSAAPTN
jgi:N-acetylmuramoyl-L-alanine amidase